MSLRKIYLKFSYSRDPRFIYSRGWQEAYINKFPEPVNSFERSYYQYLCQCAMNKILWNFTNIIAPLLIIAFLARNVFSRRVVAKEKKVELICLVFGVSEDMVPTSLIREFKSSLFVTDARHYRINKSDLKWLLSLWLKKPLSFLFVYKLLIKVSRYRSLIETYSPKCIATHSEYSCTSALVTDFCNRNGVKHYNFMHGEKPYYIRDAFFYFNKMFVFDEHYLKLFKTLRAECDLFKVEVPGKFLRNGSHEIKKEYDYCYYLAAEKKTTLRKIFESLYKMKLSGRKVKVRSHPRWTDTGAVDLLSKEFGIEVEDGAIPIEDSLASVDGVISLFSTVLLHASLLRKEICVDNVTNYPFYEKLLDLDLIFLKNKHIKFSDLLCH